MYCILDDQKYCCLQLESAAVAVGCLSPENGGKEDTISKDKLRDCVFELGNFFVMGGITSNKRVGYVLETLDRMIKVSEK